MAKGAKKGPAKIDANGLVAMSFKFTPEVKDLLEKVSAANRRSYTGTIEVLIREAAKQQNIT
jgi:hypothetical protein